MASVVEKLYGVRLPHEALLRWIGERYGEATETEARAYFATAKRRYARAIHVRAEGIWLQQEWRHHSTSAGRVEKARKFLEDPMAYIDGKE